MHLWFLLPLSSLNIYIKRSLISDLSHLKWRKCRWSDYRHSMTCTQVICRVILHNVRRDLYNEAMYHCSNYSIHCINQQNKKMSIQRYYLFSILNRKCTWIDDVCFRFCILLYGLIQYVWDAGPFIGFPVWQKYGLRI